MSAKNQTQVVINGQIFVISGYESEEYIQKVGYYLNNKLTEIQKLESYKRQSNEMKSILHSLISPMITSRRRSRQRYWKTGLRPETRRSLI
ncbi:cell division protein ZapA [Lachnospiraceae bacterium OF09-6]|nr:cell division protein ZapA [Lachnospiraceae bacterium OF09-6]